MSKKKTRILSLIAALLFLGGSLLAQAIDTNFGKTEVKELHITDGYGNKVAFSLYRPETATAETPAPAVILSHGGNGNRESMSSFAVELARRGYVVASLDKLKNGDSDAAGNNKTNGIDGLMDHLYTMDFIDLENLGSAGHSAGGTGGVIDIENNKYNIKACVANGVALRGSYDQMNTNVLAVLGRFDENAGPSNWKVPGPRYATVVPGLLEAFGLPADAEVVPGQLYGSLEDRTGRMLLTPTCFHAMMRYSTVAVRMNLEWFDTVLEGGNPNKIASTNQIWMFKELGFSMVLAAVVIFLFVLVQLFMSLDCFKAAVVPENDMQIAKNKKFWIITLATCFVSMVSVQPLYAAGKNVMSAIPGLRLEHTNGTLFWQLVIIFAVIALNYLLKKLQTKYHWAEDLKIVKIGWANVLKLFVVGLAVAVGAVVLVYATRFFFNGHAKFLQTEVTPLTTVRWAQFVRYFPMFLILQLIGNYVHTNGLRFIGCDTKHYLILTMLVNALSMTILCAVFYGTIVFMDVSLLHTSRFVIGSCLINMLPFTFVQSGIEVFCFKKTGSIYLAAFINAFLFAWMSCGGVMLAA